MSDPYKVLGIGRSATDEEIKKAYRRLSRIYHPDANINNPDKDAAEAKFKEVQQAYQQIMDEREKGFSGYNNGNGADFSGGFDPFGWGNSSWQTQNGNGSEENVYLRAAANYINAARYKEALNVLNNMSDRSALWYFYSAAANSGMGNNVTALEQAREAVRLEPGNMQFQMLLRRLQNNETWYEQRQSTFGYPVNFDTGCCMKLCIANLICNLCCGSGGMCFGGGYYI